jgi:ankyrin repeat protein
VQCGAEVNAADGGGCTGLHHAALTDDSAAASILCSSFGVDKDAPDNLGNTPLHTGAPPRIDPRQPRTNAAAP